MPDTKHEENNTIQALNNNNDAINPIKKFLFQAFRLHPEILSNIFIFEPSEINIAQQLNSCLQLFNERIAEPETKDYKINCLYYGDGHVTMFELSIDAARNKRAVILDAAQNFNPAIEFIAELTNNQFEIYVAVSHYTNHHNNFVSIQNDGRSCNVFALYYLWLAIGYRDNLSSIAKDSIVTNSELRNFYQKKIALDHEIKFFQFDALPKEFLFCAQSMNILKKANLYDTLKHGNLYDDINMKFDLIEIVNNNEKEQNFFIDRIVLKHLSDQNKEFQVLVTDHPFAISWLSYQTAAQQLEDARRLFDAEQPNKLKHAEIVANTVARTKQHYIMQIIFERINPIAMNRSINNDIGKGLHFTYASESATKRPCYEIEQAINTNDDNKNALARILARNNAAMVSKPQSN